MTVASRSARGSRGGLWLVCWCAGVLVCLAGCARGKKRVKAPQAKAGVLDLRGWDLAKGGAVPLRGEWEFYWERLVKPGEFAAAQKGRKWIVLPRAWQGYKWGDKILGGMGYATFRLRLLFRRKRHTSYALKLPYISTSYQLWVNGELYSFCGVVGRSRGESVPQQRPSLVELHPQKSSMELVLQIANFAHRSGGPRRALRFGLESHLRHKRQGAVFLKLFLLGCFVFMGLYHIGLFAFRPKDRSTLFFGLFCLSLALRMPLTGENLVADTFPGFPWELATKLEYLSMQLAWGCFVLFLAALFPKERVDWLDRALVAFCGAFVLLTLVTPGRVYTYTLSIFLYALMLGGLYALFVLLRAARHRREGANLFLIGTSVLVLAVANDSLLYIFDVASVDLVPYGFLMFIFFQSFAISWRFSRAFLAVEELSERLLSLDRLKDEFLANTSHELRTPLNGIIGLAESLIDGATGKLAKATKQNLGLIVSSGRRLASLIDDLLDFSKLKNDEIVLRRRLVDLKPLAELVLALSRPLLGDKEVVLRNEIEDEACLVMADENRLQQVLHNLIANAIKFTSAGEVRVAAVRKGDRVELVVEDTGIGIPADKLESIFRSFEQADSSTAREYGGTGLGLSISRKLVELHGGRLWVESTPGEGSRFFFSLPVDAQELEQEEAQRSTEGVDSALMAEKISRVRDEEPQEAQEVLVEESQEDLAQDQAFTVLLVDDEPVNLQVLANLLSIRNYGVKQAAHGMEALELIEQGLKPDLILLDVMMPKMSGYEVCRLLRERFPATDLPIVMLTAKNQITDLVEGFGAGANDFLTKPFSKRELFTRIRTHIRLAKINEAYGRFVPHEFLRFLHKESIIDVRLGDHVEEVMTVLFSDIRSFTTLSESMTPEENFKFINAYLERMEPNIKHHEGFIDKYIGDAIMGLFPRSADDAVLAAIDMLRTLQVYNQDRLRAGYAALEIGIGLNTGRLMLGTVGGKERMDGTVISDAVNLAARVEGMTKLYNAAILLTEFCQKDLADPDAYKLREVDRVQVKGKQEAIDVYEVLLPTILTHHEERWIYLADFERALALYRNKAFIEAHEAFEAYHAKAPSDHAATLYIQRCEHLAQEGVSDDWDGVFRLLSK